MQRARRMVLPVMFVSAAIVVCAFNGGVLGTGMLGTEANAANTRPDPTVPVPLDPTPLSPPGFLPPTATGQGPTTTVVLQAPPPPPNVPYVLLTPSAPAGPTVPAVEQVVVVPVPSPAASVSASASASASKVAPTTTRPARTTTTTRPSRKTPRVTPTTLPKSLAVITVSYDAETIPALPPTAAPFARPQAVVAGVVVLADASNGSSTAGSLTPPVVSPNTGAPAARAAESTPLPTVLIRPVLDRASPTAPASATATTGTTAVSPATDQTGERALATVPTTTQPKVYVFVGRRDDEMVPPSNPRSAEVVAWALAQIGQPYLWGGEGEGGFDCSGLSMMAWRAVGLRLTHQSRSQFAETARLNVADLEPGDLVFYGDPIHHLGIYIGDGKMVEAARQGIPVRIASIKRRDLVGAGRVRW